LGSASDFVGLGEAPGNDAFSFRRTCFNFTQRRHILKKLERFSVRRIQEVIMPDFLKAICENKPEKTADELRWDRRHVTPGSLMVSSRRKETDVSLNLDPLFI
jgi:hypothetical protein